MPKPKKEGRNKLAAKCDQVRVSPWNVDLSMIYPTNVYSIHRKNGETKYSILGT
jgi:hypothetical protein